PPASFNGLANITATLGSFYWLGFETSGLTPDKKRLAWLGAQRPSDAALPAAGNPPSSSNSSPTPVSDKDADGRRHPRLVRFFDSDAFLRALAGVAVGMGISGWVVIFIQWVNATSR
ncbi:hypothetical protein, partial [Haloferula sp.]|uniref:hypothetical protein n=1 Tax=Haloferula sp. TaxID=2497595 RepID=UPI003C789F5C